MSPAKNEAKAEDKLFPVKLLKNYRPKGEFEVATEDGYRAPEEEERAKMFAGAAIKLPVEEATFVLSKKIAERNDPIG